MDMEELAEMVLTAVVEFSEDEDSPNIMMLEEAIDSGKDLEFAIESAISYLRDCDCEDVDFFQNKFDDLTADSDSDKY